MVVRTYQEFVREEEGRMDVGYLCCQSLRKNPQWGQERQGEFVVTTVHLPAVYFFPSFLSRHVSQNKSTRREKKIRLHFPYLFIYPLFPFSSPHYLANGAQYTTKEIESNFPGPQWNSVSPCIVENIRKQT